jgi:hypothetical protein
VTKIGAIRRRHFHSVFRQLLENTHHVNWHPACFVSFRNGERSLLMGDHDSGYKQLFSFPGMVEDLLRGFVRARWVDERLD